MIDKVTKRERESERGERESVCVCVCDRNRERESYICAQSEIQAAAIVVPGILYSNLKLALEWDDQTVIKISERFMSMQKNPFVMKIR